MKKVALTIILLVSLAVLAGCAGADLKAYVEADEQTYKAVKPDYLKLLNKSTELTKEQKDRRRLLLETWGLRIENAKKSEESK